MIRLFVLLLIATPAFAAPVPKDAPVDFEKARRAWIERGAIVEWYGKSTKAATWRGQPSFDGHWFTTDDPEIAVDPIPLARFPEHPGSLKGLPPLGRRYGVLFQNGLPEGWAADLPAPESLVTFCVTNGDGDFQANGIEALKRFPNLVRLALNGAHLSTKQIAPLKALAKIESLALFNSTIETEGYAVLAELPKLDDLDLGMTKNVDAEVMKQVAKCKNLRRIFLGWNRLTDDALAPLAEMPQLRALNLYWCDSVTDAGIAHLAGLAELRDLDLAGVNRNARLGDAALAVLAKLTKLERLDLRDAKFTAEGFAKLRALAELRHLDLTSTPVDDDALAVVAGFVKLERLTLWNTAVTERGLARLAPLAEVRILRFPAKELGDGALEALGGFKKLSEIDLRGAKITDAGMKHLAGLADLRSLEITDTAVTADGLVPLAGLKNLQLLSLSKSAATDAGFAHLKGLAELRSLDAHGAGGLTDAGLVHLQNATKLRSLYLNGGAITNEGLRSLKSMSELRYLGLDCNLVTEDGFGQFAAFPHLSVLDVRGIPFDEKGVAALSRLKGLQRLSSSVKPGSPQHTALKAALPRCSLD